MAQPLTTTLLPYLEQAGLSQVSMIAALTQGLSNQNYYVRGLHPTRPNGSEWVLRINSWASSQICNRDHEVQNWQLASRVNLAPELVYISPDKQFYLSEFFEQNQTNCWSQLISANGSHPVTRLQAKWPGAEELLLKLLNGLKQLPSPQNVMGVEQQWQVYQLRLVKMQQQLSAAKTKCQTAERWINLYDQLLAQTPLVDEMLAQLSACLVNLQFSHRDLNPYNILVVGGRLKCIDFEYACSSHPLCDLASIIASHSLSSEQRRWLIANYLKDHPNLNPHADKAVPAAVDLYWVFALCWALQMAFDCMMSDGKLKEDGLCQSQEYLGYAKQYRDLIVSRF
ncbi:phosphotransferase [Shewanella sp. MBTL60-007]|uniref:phosphotransferase n=1 Tax=Shewanella sp. MBTL60-007 TaxID=2815911 RepID=UPI001BBCFFE9|nr:phosphotransferase [Shewanella sp. MBTL60-007]GIU15074.1 aminoglycoside phosphotransferase [Shewanella sp. MBTL60-007]